jgi:adenine deaminase
MSPTSIREDLGSPQEGMVSCAGFACLPSVIPNLKICDRGLVSVDRVTGRQVVPLEVEARSEVGSPAP